MASSRKLAGTSVATVEKINLSSGIENTSFVALSRTLNSLLEDSHVLMTSCSFFSLKIKFLTFSKLKPCSIVIMGIKIIQIIMPINKKINFFIRPPLYFY